MGINSVAAAAAATSSGDRVGSSLDGHNDGEESHSGPCCHSLDDISMWVVVPLDKRSAGFASVEQYLQLVLGTLARISATQFRTKVGSCLCCQSNVAQSGCRTT